MGFVYIATNLENGKQYVGFTVGSIEDRANDHFYRAFKRKSNLPFHRALRLYGVEKFDWIAVFESGKIEELAEAEIRWIKHLETFEYGYNATIGGDGGWGWNVGGGYKQSEEHNKAISDGRKGIEPWNKGKKTGKNDGVTNWNKRRWAIWRYEHGKKQKPGDEQFIK